VTRDGSENRSERGHRDSEPKNILCAAHQQKEKGERLKGGVSPKDVWSRNKPGRGRDTGRSEVSVAGPETCSPGEMAADG